MKLPVPAAVRQWADTIAARAASPAPCYEARLLTLKGVLSKAKAMNVISANSFTDFSYFSWVFDFILWATLYVLFINPRPWHAFWMYVRIWTPPYSFPTGWRWF